MTEDLTALAAELVAMAEADRETSPQELSDDPAASWSGVGRPYGGATG